MIKVLFTANKLPFSRLLCWVTKSPVSHVAICFDDRIVFHSNPMGVHINSLPWFKRHNRIVWEVTLPERPLHEEEAAYLGITLIEGRGYDFAGIFYLAWRFCLKTFFNRPLPEKNGWGSKRLYNCIEVLGEMPRWVWPDSFPPNSMLDTMTPFEVAQFMGAVK